MSSHCTANVLTAGFCSARPCTTPRNSCAHPSRRRAARLSPWGFAGKTRAIGMAPLSGNTFKIAAAACSPIRRAVSVKEVVTLAEMSREMFDTPWIKLEVIGDDYNLQPDPFALVEAAEIL